MFIIIKLISIHFNILNLIIHLSLFFHIFFCKISISYKNIKFKWIDFSKKLLFFSSRRFSVSTDYTSN